MSSDLQIGCIGSKKKQTTTIYIFISLGLRNASVFLIAEDHYQKIQ